MMQSEGWTNQCRTMTGKHWGHPLHERTNTDVELKSSLAPGTPYE
jgi:hypothetical protein